MIALRRRLPEAAAEAPPSYHVRIQPSTGWSMLNLRELWAYRDLLFILARRDVAVRYKQTAFGVIWVVLQPLLTALIFAAVLGRVAGLGPEGVPYLLFGMAGMVPWLLFAGSMQRAGMSLLADQKLITKVYFPRLLLPLGAALAVVVDFFVGFLVLLAFIFAMRGFVPAEIVAVPIIVLWITILAVGVSCWVAALNVYYRDFAYALPFLIQSLMFATPVVYSSSLLPARWSAVYALNPMAGAIDCFRWAVLGIGEFPMEAAAISLLTGSLIFVGGLLVFRRLERSFADVI